MTWSGIPYYFLQAARTAGLIDEGLALSADGWQWSSRRCAWNLARVIGGDRRGGYQYSPAFLERLWRPFGERLRGNAVINCFQLFPPSIVADPGVDRWFYIDQTLLQLFDFYGDRSTIGRRIAAQALARERDGYQSAAGIITHSRWAAESVTADYGVAAERIHVVVPGASLDPVDYAVWEVQEQHGRARASSAGDGPLKLLMVGRYWHRKGLDRLLRALIIGRRRGLRASLRVIGCPRESLPTDLQNLEAVEWAGLIDKRKDAQRFLRLLADCDLGCLLSRAEAGGIAYREYHAAGLPVLGTNAGGSPEHMIAGASIPLAVDASDEEIAEVLLGLDRDRGRLTAMRAAAWQAHRTALWDHSVKQILGFWPYGQK